MTRPPSTTEVSARPYRVVQALPRRRESAPAAFPFDMPSARLAALRHLSAQLAEPRLIQGFWNELAKPERIAHPEITVLYSLLQHGSATYVLMEFIAGETIEELVKRSDPSRVETAIPLFCQVLDAFESRNNEFVAGASDRSLAVESKDFGIVRVACAPTAKLFGTVVFRPDGSISGEVLGEGDSTRADVYPALVAVYERLTGGLPSGVAVEPSPVVEVVVTPLSAEPRAMPAQPEAKIRMEELGRRKPTPPAPDPVPPSSGMSVTTQVLIAAAAAGMTLIGLLGAASLIGRG